MSLFNNLFGSGAQQAILGTSEDEMYRNHIDHLRAHEDEMLRQKYAMQKYEAQAQINQNLNAYTKNLAQSMTNTKQGVLQGVMASQSKPFNPNEDAAYATPLSQLVTLWQANYGDKWVEVFEDDFWNSARVRLNNNDKLEGVGGWYRIKEDA